MFKSMKFALVVMMLSCLTSALNPVQDYKNTNCNPGLAARIPFSDKLDTAVVSDHPHIPYNQLQTITTGLLSE